MDRKSTRHEWLWQKPRPNWRQCQRCKLELPISHHLKVGACISKLEDSPMFLDVDGQWKLKPEGSK